MKDRGMAHPDIPRHNGSGRICLHPSIFTHRQLRPILWLMCAVFLVATPPIWAQEANPTPPVIHLTPTVDTIVGTATPFWTATPGLPPDALEPNDTIEQAAEIGWGTVESLSLIGADVDYFTGYLKAGQITSLSTSSRDNLDTWVQIWWEGQLLAENDDRTATDLGSAVTFAAPGEGWYVARVANAGQRDGLYALTVTLVAPSATPTSPPTVTPLPTITPTPTIPPTITPPFPLVTPVWAAPPTPTSTSTPTVTITTTTLIPLILRPLAPVQPTATPQVTTARVLVYYDRNNNRQPEPGEGIANMSVLAVDGQGQQVARVFTNPQGEALFVLTDTAVDRVLVPFVSAWSARIRPGMNNDDILLGLPAVRLPVFLPVAGGEE